MSDVLLISSDGLCSPSIKVKYPFQGTKTESYSWGFGWYPNNNSAAIIAKDPASMNTDVLNQCLNGLVAFSLFNLFCKNKKFC